MLSPFDSFDDILRYLDGPLDASDSSTGLTPASPEWQTALDSEPFIEFRVHPLDPKVQAFIDAHPDLTGAEWDALAVSLERSLHLPSKFFLIPSDGGFDVYLRPQP